MFETNHANFVHKMKFSSQKLFSLEICPNRNLDKDQLKSLSPAFCSITWHIYDDFQEVSEISSINLAEEINCDGHDVLLHVPCRYLSKLGASIILDKLKRSNLQNILVIQGEKIGSNSEGDFKYASDFITFVRQNFGNYFVIGVAAFIDAHPSSTSKLEYLTNLKKKVDAGANFIITQMVFDCDAFCNFYDECKQFGINIPILPGFYVINSYNSFSSMSNFCQVNVPKDIIDEIIKNKNSDEIIENYGVDLCVQLIKDIFLKRSCILGVHFFSMNNIKLVKRVCKLLEIFKYKVERTI